MLVKLLKGVVVGGKACRIGDVIDATGSDAKYLFTRNLATVYKPTVEPPAPKKRGRPRKVLKEV